MSEEIKNNEGKEKIEFTEVDKSFDNENKKLMKEGRIIVRTGSKFVGYQGSTPFFEFDENWQQMPLERTKLAIPRETVTRMFPMAYLAGKLSAMDMAHKTSILAVITLIIVLVNLGMPFLAGSSTSGQITNLTTVTNQIPVMQNDMAQQGQVLTLIANKLNVTTNYTIPTVGG
jgi:hypothetical protein